MRKKILAAAVCAATVLSLAGCASDAEKNVLANIVSNAANNASKATIQSTSTPAASKSGATSSAATNSTAASKPNTNSEEWAYTVFSSDSLFKPLDINGEYVEIWGYLGAGGKVEVPAEINGIRVVLISSHAFQGNIDITSVTIPESVVEIEENAFANCINLSEITFKGSAPTLKDDYNNPLNVFDGTPWLEAKKAENSNFFIINDVLFKGLECEGDITIPDGVKKIYSFAFYNNKKITSVSIPDGATEIGAHAFDGCVSLINATISDSVTIIGDWAFLACYSLKSVNIPKNIVNIGMEAFEGCDSLVGSLILPDSIKELGYYAFGHYAVGYNNIELVYKGTAYEGGKDDLQLREAIKQNAIAEEFGDDDFVITDNVLMKVKPGVKKIELPDTVKGIDDNAFVNCDQSIIINFKGKNYNLANLDKLKADISAN